MYRYIICNFKNYVVYLAKFLIVLFFKMFCFYQATFLKKKEKSMLIKRSRERGGVSRDSCISFRRKKQRLTRNI